MPSIPIFFDLKSSAATQYANVILGIRNAASRHAVKLNLISDEESKTVDFASLPDVAIVMGTDMPFMRSTIDRLRTSGRQAILAGADSDQFGSDVSCATPSRRAETRQLANYLHGCGKKRIALVGFGKNSINDNFRYHSVMSVVATWEHPLMDEDVWLWQHDPRECFEEFLDVHMRYDAVICPNDLMAICFINCCKMRGVRVPDDLFVASFGNMSIGRYYEPSITSTTMDMVCVGEQAYHLWQFLSANEGMHHAALKLTVPSSILVRGSTDNLHPKNDLSADATTLKADRFYYNPTISALQGIENCISQRDDIDMGILQRVMDGMNYERISDELFISGSTLRYRMSKIFADAGVRSRQEFELLIRQHLGEGNSFACDK
ncbi:MAG: substrate-binding domain-containing protein [Clostridia bacterium]